MHFLCERGNNIKLFDKDGRNALHYAALAGQVKSIRYLVEHGFNIDELEARGGSNNKAKIRCTALQLAALQAKEDAVFCLLELNANPDLTDSRGFALCEYAICSKNKEMLDLIKLLPAYHNRERDKFLLHAAVQVDNVVALSELILDKINVNTVDTEGRSVLHLACLYNAGNTADLLLNGGDLVLDARDQFGYMPLHYAARFGHVRLIELLILAGANINGKNRENCTALHLACEHNQIGAATSLLKFKADLDITNSEGFTAQQIAKDKNHTDIQEILNQENYIGNILNMHWLYSNKTNSKNLIDQTIVQQQEQKVCNLMKL
jgi:ankyrin repeat protein